MKVVEATGGGRLVGKLAEVKVVGCSGGWQVAGWGREEEGQSSKKTGETLGPSVCLAHLPMN